MDTAVAVHPEATYVLAERDGEKIVTAEPLVPEGAEILERRTGAELHGETYQRPPDLLPLSEFGDQAFRVLTADHVTMDSGTGIVHLSPAFGVEDLEVARRHGLPVVNPIGVNGHFLAEVPLIGDLFFHDANDSVIAELTGRGLLAKHEPYPHSYSWVPAWPAVRRSR